MKRHRWLVRTVILAVVLLFSVGLAGQEAAPRAAANAAYQTYLPAVLREVSRDVSVPTLLAPPDGSTISTPVVTVQWADVVGAARYYLYWREAGQYAWHGSWVDATSHVITNLAPSTTYEWRLRAFSAWDNPGPLSETWSFVTAAELVLPAATLLAPPDGSTVSTPEVTVQWDAVTGASRYYLYWREAGQYAWHGTWVDGTSRVITSLVPSTTYEWRVRVHGDSELGGLSETWRFTTPAA